MSIPLVSGLSNRMRPQGKVIEFDITVKWVDTL